MPSPARAGLFIYAMHLDRLAHFYQTVLDMTLVNKSTDVTVLNHADMQIVLYPIPQPVAANVSLESPPPPRDHAAYKFFFTVPSLSAASETIVALGGLVMPTVYRGPGFVVQNVVDPEGNIFQLRQLATTPT